MRFAAIALTAAALGAAALGAAGAAAASDRITDVDFLKANRCKGLATSIDGVVDPSAITAFVKAETRGRMPYVMERADAEFDRARREAKSPERRARLTSELTGVCRAYLGNSGAVAKQSDPASAPM